MPERREMPSNFLLAVGLDEVAQVSHSTFLEAGNIQSESWHFRPGCCINTEVGFDKSPLPSPFASQTF